MNWGLPHKARSVIAAALIASALGLSVVSRSVGPPSPNPFVPPTLRVDVNTAPADVLDALPHVGPALAQRLIAARDFGPIRSESDLVGRVRGLGPSTIAQIAPFLVFGQSEPPGAVVREPSIGLGPSAPGVRVVSRRKASGPKKEPRVAPEESSLALTLLPAELR